MAVNLVVEKPPVVRIIIAWKGNIPFCGTVSVGIYWGPDDERNMKKVISGFADLQNTAIFAAGHVLFQAKGLKLKKINIETDMRDYLYECLGKMDEWKRIGWVYVDEYNKKEPVMYNFELKRLDDAVQGIEFKFIHPTEAFQDRKFLEELELPIS